jgi:hypothetical protein
MSLIRLENKYRELCDTPSDINEHLPTLFYYSSQCQSAIELGVRGVVSTYAILYGLFLNNSNKKKLLLNDITPCNITDIIEISNELEIDLNYQWLNDLEMNITENYDLTFIDTFHVYGQLKRELDKFSKITNKYIIMHDTTVDEQYGEIIRMFPYQERYNNEAQHMSKITNIPENELLIGLCPAIEEFLDSHPEWTLCKRYNNNNGLTILEKIV